MTECHAGQLLRMWFDAFWAPLCVWQSTVPSSILASPLLGKLKASGRPRCPFNLLYQVIVSLLSLIDHATEGFVSRAHFCIDRGNRLCRYFQAADRTSSDVTTPGNRLGSWLRRKVCKILSHRAGGQHVCVQHKEALQEQIQHQGDHC